jgi:hypothetical protein
LTANDRGALRVPAKNCTVGYPPSTQATFDELLNLKLVIAVPAAPLPP